VAGLSGAARPTVNKILQELREAGAIDLGRGRIVVSDAVTLLRKAR